MWLQWSCWTELKWSGGEDYCTGKKGKREASCKVVPSFGALLEINNKGKPAVKCK